MTQVPPHNEEAEAAVIGGLYLQPLLVGDLVGVLEHADFYFPKPALIYAAMLHLHDKGEEINALTLREYSEHIDFVYINEAGNLRISVSYVPKAARLIIDCSRRRRLIAHCSVAIAGAYEVGNDFDDVLGMLDPVGDRLLSARDIDVAGLAEVREWTASRVEEEAAAGGPVWLIPHILRPRWRVIIVASEGVGKATFMRQIGLHAAAGRDPFDPARRIRPLRTLYVDLENGETTIRHQHRIVNSTVDLVEATNGEYWLWHQEGGMDLRQRTWRRKFEDVLLRVHPELVLLGPLYKAFRRATNETDEQAATDFLQTIDDLRTRYNFAVVFEHHAPKASIAGKRDLAPFGSSALLRWPEWGIALHDQSKQHHGVGPLEVDVETFRKPREPADWPDRLTRAALGSSLAWQPRWTAGRGKKVGAVWIDGQWTYASDELF